MLLENKVAVIYGAGGAVGSAVAKAFAREGARLFLAGRHLASVQPIASGINGAEPAEVDVLNEAAVERHMDQVIGRAGQVDISFNAAGIAAQRVEQQGMQGLPLAEVPAESFAEPLGFYPRANFLTVRAAVRRMLSGGRPGVVLMHTPEPARIGAPLLGGMGPAWAAMEALCRSLSAEYASRGIRAACLRTTGLCVGCGYRPWFWWRTTRRGRPRSIGRWNTTSTSRTSVCSTRTTSPQRAFASRSSSVCSPTHSTRTCARRSLPNLRS